jgi:hypothetical protein
MFEVGDIVKCVEYSGTRSELRLNKNYTITSCLPGSHINNGAVEYFQYIGVNGGIAEWYEKRFELTLKQKRKKKLIKIYEQKY